MENILERIYKSGLKLLVPFTPEKTYETIVSQGMELVNADSGAIYLQTPDGLKAVYASLPVILKVKPRRKGNNYKAFITKKAIIADISGIEKAHPEIKGLRAQSAIFIPLSYQGKAIGVLTMNSKFNEKFDNKTLDVLVLFGSMASLAIRKAQLLAETKQALETRDLFISMAAHELRTPLTTISGYVQLLKNKLGHKENSESRWIGELNWEVMRMTQLVNELLSVSRINTGEIGYSFKEKRLREIIQRAISNFEFSHPEHTLDVNDKVKVDNDKIICDFDRLLQAIDNLLDNAAKFSPPKSRIHLNLSFRNHSWILQIKDHGKGIKKEDIPRIFENYYRGAGHSHGGMGVGLYLAQNIIQKHHGDIKVRSKEKKGTTVTVKLPKIKL